jgi:hypothetical protein
MQQQDTTNLKDQFQEDKLNLEECKNMGLNSSLCPKFI